MKKNKWIVCLLAMTMGLLAMSGCGKGEKSTTEGNAIYYWRTTFRLNNYERDFLKKHNINKMYVKFFDVDDDWGQGPVPLGTTTFIDSMPAGVAIVPTVYITSRAIAQYPEFTDKMITRIKDMAEVNNIAFNEIQIDCDWTESTSKKYLSFMKLLKSKLEKDNIALSTTVRLFQLGYEVPAADYGVLMCYNTGDIEEWETENSILDTINLTPHLEKLKQFNMPLSVALPCFSWNVKFSGNYDYYFMEGIDYRDYDFSDNKNFEKISENRYKMGNNRDNSYTTNQAYLRHEEVSMETIEKVKEMLIKNMSSSPKQFVIYHLDSVNLSKLSDNDVEKIYR